MRLSANSLCAASFAAIIASASFLVKCSKEYGATRFLSIISSKSSLHTPAISMPRAVVTPQSFFISEMATATRFSSSRRRSSSSRLSGWLTVENTNASMSVSPMQAPAVRRSKNWIWTCSASNQAAAFFIPSSVSPILGPRPPADGPDSVR